MSNSIINPKRLYVSNLPAHVTVDDLKREFGNYGVVAVAEVIRDKKGRSRRFGFISFRDATSTKCAECNIDRKIFGECEINVEFATRRRNPFTAKDKNLPANTTQNKSQPPAYSLENEELERRLLEEEHNFNQARRQSSRIAEPSQLEEYNYFHSYPEDHDYLRSYQREYVEPLSAPIRQRYHKKYYYPRKSHRGERVVFLTDPDQKAAYRDNPERFIHENQEFIERNAVYIESPRRRVVYQRAPRCYPSPRDLSDPRSPLASRRLRADAPEFSPSESPQRSTEKVEERKSQSDIQAEKALRKSQIDIQTEVWRKISEKSREIEEDNDSNDEVKKDSHESEDSPRPKNLKTDEKMEKPSEKKGVTAAQSKPVTNVDELQKSQE